MRLIIDTDPAMGTLGGDPEDSFAIMLAVNSPEVNVEGNHYRARQRTGRKRLLKRKSFTHAT